MSRKKIEGNKRSRVLYTRDAYHTLAAALHLWSVDAAVSLNSDLRDGKNSALSVGTSVQIGQFVTRDLLGRITTVLSESDDESDDNFWEIPDYSKDKNHSIEAGDAAVNWAGYVDVSGNPVLGTYQLITLESAAKWLTNEFALVMRKFNLAMLKRTSIGKVGRFRSCCYWMRGQSTATATLELAIARLQQVCLSQKRKPKGPQVIQTTRRIDYPYYVPFKFNGTHAIRLPRGRPALSEAQWRHRYFLRKQKEKKTKVVHKNAKHEIRIPPTKHGRPSRAIEQKVHTDVKAVQQYVSQPKFEPDFEYDWREHGREFVEKLTEEISKGVGEEAAKKLQELMGF